MSWLHTILGVLIDTAAGGLALTLAATLAVLMIRQPARQIRVVELALAGLVVLPWLVIVPGLPRWSLYTPVESLSVAIEAVPALDSSAAQVAESRDVQKNVESTLQQAPLPAVASSTPPLAGETAGSRAEEPVAELSLQPTILPDVSPHNESRQQASQASTAGMPAPAASARAVPWPAFSFELAGTIAGLYILGVAIFAGWSMLGLFALGRVLRTARPAPAACRDALRGIAGPRSDRVPLLVSSRVGQPCAVAWWPPAIVLPERIVGETDTRRLGWMLTHEWSHIERWDVWSWTLSSFVRALYFYQPLVWWLRRRLQLAQDFLADARAAAVDGASEDYAEFLTSYAAARGPLMPAAGLGIGGRKSDLHRRVVMLVDNVRPLESRSPRLWNLLAVSLATLLIGGVATLRAQPSSKAEFTVEEAVGAVNRPREATTPNIEKELPPTDPRVNFDFYVGSEGRPGRKAQPALNSEARPQPTQMFELYVDPDYKPENYKQWRIEPGAILNINITPNIDTPGDGTLRIPLSGQNMAAVDFDGDISLGSYLGRLHLKGKTLEEAAEFIDAQIRDAIRKRHEGRNAPVDLNVQVGYSGMRFKLATASGPAAPAATYSQPPLSPPATAPSSASPPSVRTTVAPPTLDQQTAAPPANPTVSPYLNIVQNTAQQAPPAPPTHIRPGDILRIEMEGGFPNVRYPREVVVEAAGTLPLGVEHGRVNVAGKTLVEAEAAVVEHLKPMLRDPKVQITYSGHSPDGTAGSASDLRLRELEREIAELRDLIKQRRPAAVAPSTYPSGPNDRRR